VLTLEDLAMGFGEHELFRDVNLTLRAGERIALVGPNGSGKTTLMNLITGLVRPSRGRISVLGIEPSQPERLFRFVGYSTQFDAFPKGLTGSQFIYSFLRLSGRPATECRTLTALAIKQVGLVEAADRKVAAYSKGMRQRIRLAQAIAHDPRVLILDEPLNGLDPLVRSETINLYKRYAAQGRHVVVSSHVLHEVDMISDQVVLMSGGYVVAEGRIRGVRSELQEERPMQFLIRCRQPNLLASRAFEQNHVVEARVLPEGESVLVKTRDADRFCRLLNHLALDGIDIEGVVPADDNVRSVYEYLIGGEEATK
jgi:ABC-2 type transport system ATP-binding protein